MRMWNFFWCAALVLLLGFGAGYYAKTALNTAASDKTEQKSGTAEAKGTPAPTESKPPLTEPTPLGADAAAQQNVYAEEDGETKEYLLKEYLGSIAVYKLYSGGGQQLIDIVDVGVSRLPQKDRDMLAGGIGVKSKEEMLQLLEDYMS